MFLKFTKTVYNAKTVKIRDIFKNNTNILNFKQSENSNIPEVKAKI